MWANRLWTGVYVPQSTPTGGELEAYARVVNAVEGNTTFYAAPDRSTAEKWAASVPDDFRFMFKLPRSVTHDRKLRDADEPLREFLAAMEPMGERMRPTSIQLPAAFSPRDLPVLDQFLADHPLETGWAVEVRHPGFFGTDDELRLNDLLHARGVDRIILDSRALFAGPAKTPGELEAFENKPRLPVRAVATGVHPIVRFIGQTDEEANPEFWKPWVETVVRWLGDGRSPFVFLHTPDNAPAPAMARRFHDEVRALVPELVPLPEPPPVSNPGLFD
jgi:uncharacterized protein YecE (DUF72 family)